MSEASPEPVGRNIMDEPAIHRYKLDSREKQQQVFIRRVGYASQGSSFQEKMMVVQQLWVYIYG